MALSRRRRGSDRLEPSHARGERVATAALALGALALVLAFSHRPPEPADCSHPRELAAHDGWTTAVSCDTRSAAGGPLRGPVRLLFGEALDLNRSDARALEALPAIGPSRAAAIVLTRSQRPLQSLRDLERVPGIGPRIASGLRGWVSFSGLSETPEAQ
jgi:hypothetical protein